MIFRFIALPYCFVKQINWNHCDKSYFQIMKDLIYIFFRLGYYPDNYSPCRLWEKTREEWSYYYGSTYNPLQRYKLRKEVQRYEYQILFNDKVVCDQLCKSINVRMPKTYGVINKNDSYNAIIRNIFVAHKMHKLILKPIMGHAGMGIVMAINEDGKIIIDDKGKIYNLDEFIIHDKYIIQEIISQDQKVASFSSSSINTVRVVTLYTRKHTIKIISASMRFGVGDSYVDNWSAGGIAVGVDYSKGTLMKIAYDKHGNQYKMHPVSKKIFYDFMIPYWNEVIELASKIQFAFPYYKLLGMDIAIQEDGPTLIEINANPDIIFQEQTSGPLLRDEEIYNEFKEYDLLVNRYQKNLYK